MILREYRSTPQQPIEAAFRSARSGGLLVIRRPGAQIIEKRFDLA